MGKQSDFTRRDALNVLSSLSSANTSNSALQAELKRTRRNVSVLASRLREAQTTMALMEEILFSLLPPAPPAKDPPELPPRPAARPRGDSYSEAPQPLLSLTRLDTDMDEPSSGFHPPESSADEPDRVGTTCGTSQDAQVVDRPEAPTTPPPIVDPFGSPGTPPRSLCYKMRISPMPMTPLRIGVPPPKKWLCGKDTTPAREWGRAPAPSALDSPTRETIISHARPPPSLLIDMRPEPEPETPKPQMTTPEAPMSLVTTTAAPEAPAREPPTENEVRRLHNRLMGWADFSPYDNPAETALRNKVLSAFRIHREQHHAAGIPFNREIFDSLVDLLPDYEDDQAPPTDRAEATTEAHAPQPDTTAEGSTPQPRKEKKRNNKKKGVGSPPSG